MSRVVFSLVIALQLLFVSCSSLRKKYFDVSYVTSLTQQYLDHLLRPYLSSSSESRRTKTRKFLIRYVDHLPRRHRALMLDEHCTTKVVDTNYEREVKLPLPHTAVTWQSSQDYDPKCDGFMHVHPLYRAKEKGSFCYIVSSGHDVEYTGEEWGILYIARKNEEGQIILGEMVEEFMVWS